jgi:carnosine N-methyltransferase
MGAEAKGMVRMPLKRRVFLKLYLSHVGKGESRMQPCPGDEAIFQEVVASMAAHDENSSEDLRRWMRDFALISDTHQRMLQSSMKATFDGVAGAIVANQRLLDAIVSLVDESFLPCTREQEQRQQQHPPARIGGAINYDKCWGTLRQFAREWSSPCAYERLSSFGPMLMHLNAAHGGLDAQQRASVRVLVPGSGLGRLMWEICKCGFSCEGNEFSYHMLMGCSFALNHFSHANEFAIQPWAGGVSNHLSLADRLMEVQVPDEVPCLPNEDIRMSMVAGEFCEVYNSLPGMFDVVCTCFFIDTAPNALDYIGTIYSTLKDGGMWINNGPLMCLISLSLVFSSSSFIRYHFEGGSDADEWQRPCVYLTQEQLLECVRHQGFDIVLVQPSMAPSLYTSAENRPKPALSPPLLSVFQLQPQRHGTLDISPTPLCRCEKKARSGCRRRRTGQLIGSTTV